MNACQNEKSIPARLLEIPIFQQLKAMIKVKVS